MDIFCKGCEPHRHPRRRASNPPTMAAPSTDHSDLVARVNAIIRAVEAAALDDSASIDLALTTVQQPLQALKAELETLDTTLRAWGHKGDVMDAVKHELRKPSPFSSMGGLATTVNPPSTSGWQANDARQPERTANNEFRTLDERAVIITDILDRVGRIDDDYIASFGPLADGVVPILARLYALLALLCTDPHAAVAFRPAVVKRIVLGPGTGPAAVVAQAPSTKEEVFAAAKKTVRGLVRRAQALYVGAEVRGEKAVLAGGRYEAWKGWVEVNGGNEEAETEEMEVGGYA